jgi:hypothetical protein
MTGRHPGFAFDEALHVGQQIEARFTNHNRAIRFRGRILKLSEHTALVESLDDGVNGWAAGHVFVVQRFSSPLGCDNNDAIFPWHHPAPRPVVREFVLTGMRSIRARRDQDALNRQHRIADHSKEVQAEAHFIADERIAWRLI